MALSVDDSSIRPRPPPPEPKPAAAAASGHTDEPNAGAAAAAAAAAPSDGFDASHRAAPVAGTEGASAPAEKPPTYPGGIDRRRFLAELQKNPGLITKAAWMVRGEVGNGASQAAKIAMLETAFNRAQARGIPLSQALLSVGESRKGYYARQTYGGGTPSKAEVENFEKNVLTPVLAGSDVTSQAGHGAMTGNASGSVARHQLQRGTPGFAMKIEGGQTEYLFNEDGKKVRDLPRLDAAGAEDAANRAKTIAPNGVVPISQPSLSSSGGSEPSDSGTRTGGARRRGRTQRSAPPQPAHAPAGAQRRARSRRAEADEPQQFAQAQPQASPLAQQLKALGLGDQQISQMLSQLGQDSAFQQFLNGRGATPELMQQYLQENPERAQAFAQGVQQPLSAVG